MYSRSSCISDVEHRSLHAAESPAESARREWRAVLMAAVFFFVFTYWMVHDVRMAVSHG